MDEQAVRDLAEAFDGNQITDSEGQIIGDETSIEEAATQEPNALDDTATAEKPEESSEEETKSSTDNSENADDDTSEAELAEDDKGKRYVPEKRLKKETAKRYEAERRAKELEAKLAQHNPVKDLSNSTDSVSSPDMETELLYLAEPQFNPNSDQYNKQLDVLGLQIFRANPGITKVEAARRAKDVARGLTSDQAKVLAEARTVKAQQSDQGITSRVVSRNAQADPDKMSLQEKEAYLKANGQWD